MVTLLVMSLVSPGLSHADQTYAETTGGVANTWTNYTNAGGTAGPQIGSNQTVQIACKVTGFRVADGNTWWYRIAQSPWNNQFYVSADAFYNNGATSGSLHGTPFVDPAVPDCSSLPTGNNQTTGGVANTWTDYNSAGGTAGPQIGANQTVVIACKLTGFKVADGNTWWYRIASAPWSGNYYVSADAFYNNGATSGSLIGTPFVDPAVPDCAGSAGGDTGGGKPAPSVTLAQGPIAPQGYRYAITLSNFSPGSSVSTTCYDSVDTGGFLTLNLRVDGNGSASISDQSCISGDGPDHWVIAGGVESNHVNWSGSQSGTPTPSPGGTGSSTPPATSSPASSNGYIPSHITLQANAGTRERNLLALRSAIDNAARGAGIDGQVLARVIYHEGGNYLGTSWRKTATQTYESRYSGSVGIGQIRIETARLVLRSIYGDTSTASQSDAQLRNRLVYDTNFSLKISAGYIRMMKNAGINGSYEQFMSYCLSVDGAKAWAAMYYTLDRAQLAKINPDTPAILNERATFYRQAVAAIG